MIKKNKLKLIISSIVIMIPTLLAFLGGKVLPEKIAVHWGLSGNADGWMSPSLIFVILPSILLVIHWICMILTDVIDKNVDQNKKVMGMFFWIMPVISLASCGLMLATALGKTVNIFAYVLLFLAAMFIVIGNYSPKMTRSRTVGIKIKWTLSNDENWGATHRFTGKLYVAVGFLCLLALPLPHTTFPFIAIGIILICVIPPIIYSYLFYKKQLKDGRATEEDYKNEYGNMVKNKKLAIVISIALTVILSVFLIIVLFTGDLEIYLDDTSLNVKASFCEDLSISYDEIDSIEYREDSVSGTRVVGFGSPRLSIGTFSNDEIGAYTRYTYTGNYPCVVIRSGERTIVVGVRDGHTVREIYERISFEISQR